MPVDPRPLPNIRRRVGDRVYVPDLELHAHVQAILVDEDGVQYRVSYFHEGDRKTCFVFDRELADPR